MFSFSSPIIVVSFILISINASAVTLDKSTADLGFGYTDNVYQDDLNKVSDAFFNLGATFRPRLPKRKI
jgi:hypothetical protein